MYVMTRACALALLSIILLAGAAGSALAQTGPVPVTTPNVIYDISTTKTPTAPIADFVMQLPIYTLNGGGGAPNRTAAQSELLALNDTQFLVLSRDALGLGLTTGNSVFKSVLLVDTGGATKHRRHQFRDNGDADFTRRPAQLRPSAGAAVPAGEHAQQHAAHEVR